MMLGIWLCIYMVLLVCILFLYLYYIHIRKFIFNQISAHHDLCVYTLNVYNEDDFFSHLFYFVKITLNIERETPLDLFKS